MVRSVPHGISHHRRTGYRIGKVNVDEEPELASKFDVMSIPTLLVFEDGELVNRAVGARPKEMILDLFEE